MGTSHEGTPLYAGHKGMWKLDELVFLITIKYVFRGFVIFFLTKDTKNFHVWMSPHEIQYIYKDISPKVLNEVQISLHTILIYYVDF